MFYPRKTVRPAHIGTCKKSRLCTTAALFAFFIMPVNALAALDLDETVRLALLDDPAIKAMQARASAISDAAVADGQLPDPQLKTGLYNLPVDDFDIDREPTTQLRLGLVQAFPRGKTLQYTQQQTEWLAQAELANSEITGRKLVRDVRKHFLELYYQIQAEQVVRESRKLFAQLVDITQAHYANGRVSQQDVLSASLELYRLDDRTTRILNEADKGRAALMKWIGDTALLPIDDQFPELPNIPSKETIAAALPEHPLIRAETAKLAASKRKIQIANEQYKPGWSAGLEYRKRFGDDPDGDSRADMMAAMVTVDIPLFTENRQDKNVAAREESANAARYTRDDKLRILKRKLEKDRAIYRRLGERELIYKNKLVNSATSNAEASLNAYQSGVTEFTTLMRARITELDVRLDNLRIKVDRLRAQARLLYVTGEPQ